MTRDSIREGLVELPEQMIQRVRDRLVMRRSMLGDVNETLALELECMVSELERIADEARAAALRAKAQS